MTYCLYFIVVLIFLCSFKECNAIDHDEKINLNVIYYKNLYNLSYLLSQLKSELVTKQKNLIQSECMFTFSIDSIAEEFYLELLKDKKLHYKYNFQYDYRQFVNEILLLEYFRISKCRIKIENHNNKNLRNPTKPTFNDNIYLNKEIHRLVPHYYIIFIPFKYLYGLKDTITSLQKQKLTLIIENILKSPSFQYDKEHYVIIYTATFSFQGHFISHLVEGFALQVLDTRIVRIAIEGIGGDNRLQFQNDRISKAQHTYQLHGSRMIVVPYFVDRMEHIYNVLRKVEMLNYASSFMNSNREIKYYMRASAQKGSDLRLQLNHTFNNISNAVVKLSSLNKHFQAIPIQLYTHYIELQKSLFCICPYGLTASASRYQKALEAGCIPVIISDNVTLPFEVYNEEIMHWDKAVIRYPESRISQLPQYLESLSMDRINSLQVNGKMLTQRLRYLGSTLLPLQNSNNNSSSNVFDLLEKELYRFSSFETNNKIFSDDILAGIKTYQTLIITICDPFNYKESNRSKQTYQSNNNSNNINNNNLFTSNCSQWLQSVRTIGYEGPIIIILSNHIISNIEIPSKYLKYTYLLSNINLKLFPNHPPSTSKYYHNFTGKQLQLVWKSYILANIAKYISDTIITVIIVDSKDVLFRKNPFASLSLHSSNCHQRSVLVSQHCDTCNVINDNYSKTLGRKPCSNPLIDRRIVIGKLIALTKLYMKASILASSVLYNQRIYHLNYKVEHKYCFNKNRINDDDDDQLITTEAIYELQKLEPNKICIIPHQDKSFHEIFKIRTSRNFFVE